MIRSINEWYFAKVTPTPGKDGFTYWKVELYQNFSDDNVECKPVLALSGTFDTQEDALDVLEAIGAEK